MKKQKLKEQIKKCRQGTILWKYCDFHNNKCFVENSDKNVVGFFFLHHLNFHYLLTYIYIKYNNLINMKYTIIKVLTWFLSYLDIFSALWYKRQSEGFKLSWIGTSLNSNTKKTFNKKLRNAIYKWNQHLESWE